MANNKITSTIKISAANKTRLQEAGTTIEDARKRLALIKELGIDTSPIDEKLEWAAKIRETLLKNF